LADFKRLWCNKGAVLKWQWQWLGGSGELSRLFVYMNILFFF
jgi:hypothetical protein